MTAAVTSDRVVVGRGELLSALESVRRCVAQRESHSQATCFAFKAGEVHAYDGEMACRGPSGLPDLWEGAVEAKKLLELLRRTADETVEVRLEGGELRVYEVLPRPARGQRQKRPWNAGFAMEPEFRLPVSGIPVPDDADWKELPDDFCEGLLRVAEAAGKDAQSFVLTCVSLTADCAEAFDGFQAARWEWHKPLSIQGRALILKQCAEAASELGVNQYQQNSDGDADWLHFRNRSHGFVLSCRPWLDQEFPSSKVGEMTSLAGEELCFPPELPDVAKLASLFSADGAETDMVEVILRDGEMEVVGSGTVDYIVRHVPIDWSGPDLAFFVHPGVLERICKNHQSATVGRTETGVPASLHVTAGPYRYATTLVCPAGVDPEVGDEIPEDE